MFSSSLGFCISVVIRRVECEMLNMVFVVDICGGCSEWVCEVDIVYVGMSMRGEMLWCMRSFLCCGLCFDI